MLSFLLDRNRKNTAADLVKLQKSSSLVRLKQLIFKIACVFCLHVILMIVLEKLSLKDAVWLTLTTVTTVGYGDISAATVWGQVSTIVLLYVLGIWMVAQLAGEYLDYRLDRKEQITKGLWSWKAMKEHIVIVNAPQRDSEIYLERLVTQFRETPLLADLPIVIVSHVFEHGLPKTLVDQGVVYKQANTSQGDFFDDVAMHDAKYIVFLAQHSSDPRSDCLTMDLLDQYTRSDKNQLIIAEAVLEKNKQRFRQSGCDAVIRPLRAYPEVVARAISAPGTEQVLEDFFSYHGASIYRYDVALNNVPWKKIVITLLEQDIGTALAYIDNKGNACTCPPEGEAVEGKALLIMARAQNKQIHDKIQGCLAALSS